MISFSLSYSILNLSIWLVSMSKANSFLSLLTFDNAFKEIRPWLPQPQIVATAAADDERYLAAIPVAAPVRIIVISIESIKASNRPFVASQPTMTPWMVGNPCSFGLQGKLALTFATK